MEGQQGKRGNRSRSQVKKGKNCRGGAIRETNKTENTPLAAKEKLRRECKEGENRAEP